MPEEEKKAYSAFADGISLFNGAPSNHVKQVLNMRNTVNMGIYFTLTVPLFSAHHSF